MCQNAYARNMVIKDVIPSYFRRFLTLRKGKVCLSGYDLMHVSDSGESNDFLALRLDIGKDR